MPPKKVEAVKDNVVAFGRVRKNLKMGCVGLPNVGKSSLFNLLTEQSAAAENYPFCTIEPNESRCAVPDARYDFLCDLWKPPSMYPPYLQVTDIAGLIKGASQGAGLGNAFLSHIQAVDGMFHIVRYSRRVASSVLRLHAESADTDAILEHSTTMKCCMSTTRSILYGTWVSSVPTRPFSASCQH